MKNTEKFKFVIVGILISTIFFLLLSSTANNVENSEIGRYQAISSASEHFNYCIILDTKTGDFIETGGSTKMFDARKINKGNFKELHESKE